MEFTYTVRKSSRAKRAGIKISERAGVVIVIPHKKRINIEKILKTHNKWIQDTLVKLPAAAMPTAILLPQKISLVCLGKDFYIQYRRTTAKNVIAKLDSCDELIVYGNVQDEKLCVTALSKWLQDYAKDALPAMLSTFAETCNMNYSKCNVRGQGSRWGSCSNNKVITLNRKLLFLPLDLVEYIFLHELCHTKEMNHSKNFWQWVEKYDSNYKLKDLLVSKKAWAQYIPRWADG
jgi:predicted metal-dependent hydrolase